MKIGIISDVHCNVQGLQGALEGMEDCDEVFCAGDAVYGFRFSNDVIDLIRTRGVRMVMGNHDRDFLRVWKERGGSNGHINPENLEFLIDTPYQLQIELGGRRIWMTHGSPIEPYWEYVFHHNPKYKKFGELETDILLLGHTHEAHVERVGKVLICNPGSAGEMRDPTRPFLTYATIDLQSEEAKVHIVQEPDPSRGLFLRDDQRTDLKILQRLDTP
ncbi:MAG: metallophosphoesterase family protein [Chloroflexi bacterium]|nr:metallophosphoesterase family protein [Chloroflexota bacterium]